MDLHLKQWRNQHESEQQPSAKIPKLLLDPHQQNPSASASASLALPLFVPEQPSTKLTNLSALPDSSSRFPKMGSYFSLAQWQELELQALIYRYMLAGAAVPPELLQPIKKSLLHSSPYFLHHPLQHYAHYQPAWYWSRAALDPEPGRCRRTDGKKWRCSRDVVAGQKYCERHMHRGRNRSRKPVEIPTPNTTAAVTPLSVAASTVSSLGAGGGGLGGSDTFKSTGPISMTLPAMVANGPSFGLAGPASSADLLHLNHSSSEFRIENKGLFEAQNEVDNRPDGHILRHFFDDWPRSLQEPDNAGRNASPMSSSTCLTISSSDVSLKLSTGNADELTTRDGERDQLQLNWAAGWATNQMGGPLAEALRSSTSNSSPTSVLHQLPRNSATESSYVSTCV
ncbi:growth-regulating factor 3 isoform X2 [Carica papaya]|uniref:growth-regulating factor 3 isoform X2 n=1 Tax=Carica papaya TaxID=3649 RepID=UPI00042D7F95|nr:growth-regulating factor 3 isoform X2 [Carica papaya]